MWTIRSFLLSGAALGAAAGIAMADGTVDIDNIAAKSAPVLPPGAHLLVISKTPALEVPGLPMTTKEKLREGTSATTITILPAAGASANGAVSWSGYTSSGTVYKGSN